MRLLSWRRHGYNLLSPVSATSYRGIYDAEKSLPPPPTTNFFFGGRRGLLTFLILYFLTFFYYRSVHSYRDPTSPFFDREAAFAPRYSAVRQVQADKYILSRPPAAPSKHKSHYGDYSSHTTVPKFCVGIATVTREKSRYFRTTVGSVLEGLSPRERERIWLTSFFADTDPERHPAYSEDWMNRVSDKVLTYNGLPLQRIGHLKKIESSKQFHIKAILDYTYLMKYCMTVGSPYIMMIEDDTLMSDGWLPKVEKALEKLETSDPNFLYLRLFFAEFYLGWNSEEWLTYLTYSLAVVFIANAAVITYRRLYPHTRASAQITPRTLFTFTFVYLPLSISLYFLLGRCAVQPFPRGVVAMNNFGCCSQGLIFPREKAERISEWYQAHDAGYADDLTERFANRYGLNRYAIQPPVLQHVGSQSSKHDYPDAPDLPSDPLSSPTPDKSPYAGGFKDEGDDYRPPDPEDEEREEEEARLRKQKEEELEALEVEQKQLTPSNSLWSFSFEMQSASRLRKEHEAAIKADDAKAGAEPQHAGIWPQAA